MTARYLIKLEPDDNDTLLVTCPALPEVATFGEDEAGAALKVSLYRSLREAGLTRAELMRRLGWNRESVDRLFRLDRASRLDQLEAAFKALGRSVDVSIERAA